MFNFIKEYFELLITAISCLLTIISFILKNKSNNTSKKIFRILSVLPAIINEAEEIFKDVNKSGQNKLCYVLEKLQVLCSEVNLSYDDDFWKNKIEDFLSSPQKK